ncbi:MULTISPECIES: hypothetical protein [Rhodomicrobium]|uniref:hypothetical protein n=1 Tax=Rhodomicrobium TaxID=1068 RepID=UPI001AEC76BB|nr:MULTISPECIES: hypothetical protein [Rhodomicrobium]
MDDIEVQTVRFAELHQCRDAELLDRMDGRFDLLVTTDANLRYQQNIPGRPFAVIVLRASSNRLADLLPLAPELLRTLQKVIPGEFREIV